MRRTCRGLLSGFAVLGVLVTSSGARADQPPDPAFRITCSAGDQVDKDRAAAICAEIIATAQEQPGRRIEAADLPPLGGGPGLEIVVETATDTRLELTPTWVDVQGRRVTQDRVGYVIVDAAMTETRRRQFYRRLLASSPQ